MFEFDSTKSAANKAKHGIDFEQVMALWDGVIMTMPSMQMTHGERRYLVIGEIGEKRWTVVTTERDGVIRIISARRARPMEEFLYEQARQDHR